MTEGKRLELWEPSSNSHLQVEIKDEYFELLEKRQAPVEMYNIFFDKMPVNAKSFIKACELNKYRYVIDKEIDPNIIVDDKNQNIIDYLLTKKDKNYIAPYYTIGQLAKLGADVNHKFLYENKQITPLIYSVMTGPTFGCSEMLENGADPNIQIENESTALICAIKNKDYPMALKLAEHPKTNKKITDKQGKTALDSLEAQKKMSQNMKSRL